jgi:adenosylmethionine---8-amino-7-oxononanoate aminotransferase
MSDLVILGTDTNAGKTTFALLWMAAFTAEYDYWKPLETGESDSATIRRLVPKANVHSPLLAFEQPVAPLLAARTENVVIPQAQTIAAARPAQGRPVLVETFGGPFSPLNETELQIEFIHALGSPCIVVTSSAVGAVGRTIQCLNALAGNGIVPVGIVLVGDKDRFAVDQIKRHWHKDVVWCLQTPKAWDAEGVAIGAIAGRDVLLAIRDIYGQKGLILPTPCGDHIASDLIARDKKAVWHPYTSLGDAVPPLVCVGARDEFLQLEDGRRIIDAISSWWTILHGHRHPVLMAALAEACDRFDHVHFAGVTHEPAVELSELLLRSSPWPTGRVFFSDNGSTAVEVALKMAYQFWCHRGEPQRTRFIAFEHGYHGDTFGAMAVGRDPLFFGRFEPFLFQASSVPLSAECLDAELTRHKDKVAAVIVEPLVQAAGGMRMHTPATLHDLAEVARRHGVLFIADEVMTGGGRTGTLWAHQAATIIPDLICTGKTLAGGVLPLAATMVAPHIVNEFATSDPTQTFFHGHSFTAHPLACAVAVANWKTLLAEPMTAPIRMEVFWRETFSPLKGLANVRDLRVLGSIAAIELAGEGGYLAKVGRHVREECLKRGVLVRPLGNVVYAMPPLLTSTTSLEQIADAIKAAIA